MRVTPDVVVDVVIFGGGIAGLWLLDRLKAEGYSAALFEAGELGAGQSVASQGIIHGGTKYTLGLTLDSSVKELRAMPATWQASLGGTSGPDLSGADVLSPSTYLWLPRQVGGRTVGAFSRLIMQSRVHKVPRHEWPEALRSPGTDGTDGTVYALDEFVLDMPSVLAALRAAHRESIRGTGSPEAISFAGDGELVKVGDLTVRAQRVVLTAGSGNQGLLNRAGIEGVHQQLRPLHQVMVNRMNCSLYAHCVGKRTKPLATVTAHPSSDGGYIWYVGGLLAEDGVTETSPQLIARARRELPRLFPAADFSEAGWATLRIDRAEGAVTGARRPGGPVIQSRGRLLVAWPTKLALAPRLSAQITATLHQEDIRPGVTELAALASLPEPAVARPPWERIEAWS